MIGRPACSFAVAAAGVDAAGLQKLAREFGDKYRAVLASGAADADGEVAAVIALIVRLPLGDESRDLLSHLTRLATGFEECLNRHVEA